ncbi:MAG: DUF3179 domain-containing protein [Alphaproteobacteria bacterium]
MTAEYGRRRSLRRRVLTLALVLLVSCAAVRADAQDGEQPLYLTLRSIIFGSQIDGRRALSQLRLRGGTDAVPGLVLARRYSKLQHEIDTTLAALTGNRFANDWSEWMVWLQNHSEVTPHHSYLRLKLDVLNRMDRSFNRFLRIGGAHEIRLEEVVWRGVRVDGIPALTDPVQMPAFMADFMTPDEPVFGVEIDGDARAYPLRIVDWHEVLNDVVGGVPVTLAYGPLSGAGILFDRRVEGRDERFEFGTSGLLYRSNELMYDVQTDSLWSQFTGRPVVGPLTGSGIRLDILPIVLTSWADWRDRHPDTKVLSPDTGHTRAYLPHIAYGGYASSQELIFPSATVDTRLPAKAPVFGVRVAAGVKAWPLAAFAGGRLLNDSVGYLNVVVIGDADTQTARVYRRDGHTFAATRFAEVLREGDDDWTVTEAALVGPRGVELPRVAGHVAYWFAWTGFGGADTELYVEPPPQRAVPADVTAPADEPVIPPTDG